MILDIINEIACDIDAEMRAAKRDQYRRHRFPVQLDWVRSLPLCPDWPPERLLAYAQRRPKFCVADIIEDGLNGEITLQDAVWFVLQPGPLQDTELRPFVIATAETAIGYIGAYLTRNCTPVILPSPLISDWRYAELALHTLAREYSLGVLGRRNEAGAQLIARASRICGMLAQWADDDRSKKLAIRVSKLAAEISCSAYSGVATEFRRQLLHLHALVT